MDFGRITVFAGHYGSGKTSLAVNAALALRRERERVALCDLDIVNPYFRTADAADELANAGVELITSSYAGTNVEVPAMPAQTQRIFDDAGLAAVIDLGGDDRGALALGRYAAQLKAEGAGMLLVINRYRPLTRDLAGLREIRAEIEAAARVPFTGVANNSNLGPETTLAQVAASLDFAEETAAALGLPLRFTAVEQRLLDLGDADTVSFIGGRSAIFPVSIYKKALWQI